MKTGIDISRIVLGNLDSDSFTIKWYCVAAVFDKCRFVGVLPFSWILFFFYYGSAKRDGAPLFAPQVLVHTSLSLSVFTLLILVGKK